MLALLLVGLIMLLALCKQFFAVAPIVFVLALEGKKVLRVLVDVIRVAIKRLAGACGRENECPKRIHYGFLRRNRGLAPIVFLVIALLGWSGEMRVALAEPACDTRLPEFIQISSMQLDAGEQTFEDFRILATDVVEWARWDSNGALLGHGIARNLGKKYYERVLSSQSMSALPRITYKNDKALGRPAFRLELAWVSKSGVRLSTMTTMPDDLAAVIGELRNRIVPDPRGGGLYLWTRPFGASGQAVDIDLSREGCSGGIARTLAEALTTGHLLVRADPSARDFVSGEHANRLEFIAKTEAGAVRFGLIEMKKF